ncbi:MAG: helix-turn-helix domain-containing protein, partial [Chloroflexota bacterium]|nr:helix-turn-helix domain-containing protein [Chloroflexota bacterium]
MTATDSKRFGATLRRSRRAAGLTQESLAERAGISAKAISDLERDAGRAGRIPRLDTVVRLAAALGLDATGRAALLASARPDDHPAASSAFPSVGADAMPRSLTPLLGRAGITSAVAEHLVRGDTRLVTLTGPGGVGKTRVAIAVAERVTGAFAHGARFVDLAPLRDPELVLPTIAQQL